MKVYRTGFVKQCSLNGCQHGCDEYETRCEYVPVMIVPIDEAEMENDHVKGRLQFGQEESNLPWTSRALDSPVQPLLTKSATVYTKLGD